MLTQSAFHLRGATVHEDSLCLTARRARPVTLTGAFLPQEAAGVDERWKPCQDCGAPLVLALAQEPGPREPWLLYTPVLPAGARSWLVRRQDDLVDLREDLVAVCGLHAVPALESATCAAAHVGLMTPEVMSVLRFDLFAVPLPDAALRLHGDDPARFADVAVVFQRLQMTDGAFPDLSRKRWETSGGLDALRDRATDLWEVADAVLCPAGA